MQRANAQGRAKGERSGKMTEQERRIAQGKRILMARTGSRYGRTKFSEAIAPKWRKVSRTYIQRIEEGEKDADVGFVLAVAEVTGQPVEWLFGLTPEELDRVMPGYRDSTRKVWDNHSPLGLLTHPQPALAA
jgi:transcriptional regulator with XRE-family HTH domain